MDQAYAGLCDSVTASASTPTPAQREALARAFGCARVVYNDGLRLREEAYKAGLSWVSDGDLLRLVTTEAKRTPERAWLAEVSAVVLQQSVADLHRAYRNYFAALAEVITAASKWCDVVVSFRHGR